MRYGPLSFDMPIIYYTPDTIRWTYYSHETNEFGYEIIVTGMVE